MATVAFYGWLDNEHGTFCKPGEVVIFMSSTTGELRVVENTMDWQFAGEVGLCETQALLDRIRVDVDRKLRRCAGCGMVGCRGEAACDEQMALPLVAA